MKIAIAPDSYKGSLTSIQVAEGIARGIRAALPDAELALLPLADGGEGTTQSIIAATGGQWRHCIVTGPLGKRVGAAYGILPDGSGIAEMASASGIEYLKREELDPLQTTTFGTGELIAAMLDEGIRDITLGIGGSATVDGGAGMAQALGFRLLDNKGNEIPRGGVALAQLHSIDSTNADPRLLHTRFRVACDVTNPLLGKAGSAHIFGPQKGASPKMVEQLETALANLARVWE
jgi:glycerate kinase